MSPKVTVLIPVFNSERFVADAIRSVLEHDFAGFELLLVEGGSTDRTAAILDEWKARDPRVVVITTAVRESLPAALNRGLAHARGEYIARLDSDDLMMRGRLAAQAAVLDAQRDVVLVSCAYDIADLAGNHRGRWQRDEPAEVTAFLLHFFNVVGGAQVMFRRADALAAGGYKDMLSEDYDLWTRMKSRGRIETLPLVGITKRTNPDGALARSLERWDLRHAAWSAIMRPSLEPYLQRSVSDRELDALITLWRRDGKLGNARDADAFMREAFARFCSEVGDDALQSCARSRIARQWYLGARTFARRGHPLEAMRYLMRAARWRA